MATKRTKRHRNDEGDLIDAHGNVIEESGTSDDGGPAIEDLVAYPGAAPVSTFNDNEQIQLMSDMTIEFVRPNRLAPLLKKSALPKSLTRFSLGMEDTAGKLIGLPFGLTVLSGPTGGSKSELMNAVVKNSNGRFERINLIEPHDSETEAFTVPTFMDPAGALGYALKTQVLRPTSLTIIDSLRAPLFNTKGSAAAKGVIMAFFTALTNISNTLAVQGRTVVATVNPMDDDPAYVELFLQKLVSSVPSAIILESARDKQIYEGTISVRNNASEFHRVPRPFVFYAATSKPAVKIAAPMAAFPEAAEPTSSTPLKNLHL